MIKIILFDYDGVLTPLNMEEAFDRAWKTDLDKKEKMKLFWKYYIKFGEENPTKIPYCEEFFNLLEKNSGHKVNRDFFEQMQAPISHSDKLRKCVIELIQDLSKKYKIGLFTGTFKESKINMLKENNLFELFDYIFPINKNINGKPHPDAFNSAQERMGIKREEVLLVDDNIVRGIFPAIRFGWKTCFLNTTKYLNIDNIPKNLKPDFIINNLNGLKNIL